MPNSLAPGRVSSPALSDSAGLQKSTTSLDASLLLGSWLEGRSEHTRRAYAHDIEDFRAFLSVETADTAVAHLLLRGNGVANGVALAYRANLRSRRLSPATINRRLAALRSLVALARLLGIVSWNLQVSNLRSEAYRDTMGPGRVAVRAILEILAAKSTPQALRDLALLRLLNDLALRRSEVVSLDLEHIDFNASRVAVLRKGMTQRIWLSLPRQTLEAIRSWLARRGESPGALFLGFRGRAKGKRLTGGAVFRIVRRLGKAVGVCVRPHGLRHTAISAAVKAAEAAGIGLEEVLDFSGHADVRTLLLYRDRERNVQGELANLVADTT